MTTRTIRTSRACSSALIHSLCTPSVGQIPLIRRFQGPGLQFFGGALAACPWVFACIGRRSGPLRFRPRSLAAARPRNGVRVARLGNAVRLPALLEARQGAEVDPVTYPLQQREDTGPDEVNRLGRHMSASRSHPAAGGARRWAQSRRMQGIRASAWRCTPLLYGSCASVPTTDRNDESWLRCSRAQADSRSHATYT